MMQKSKTSTTVENVSKNKSHWSFNLINAMKDPKNILQEDELIVVLRDKFPKATYHFLVLPKQDIAAIGTASKQDLPLLRHMQEIGYELANQHKGHEFLVGYHAVPSLYRLHLHVISNDFNSPSLKTIKHWNSFTTPYFLPSRDVIKELEEIGEIRIDINANKAYMKRDLKCHKCVYIPKNMPDLKNHILQHLPQNVK